MSVLFLSPYSSFFISFYAFYFCSEKKATREDYVRLFVLLPRSFSCQFFHKLITKSGVEITYNMSLSKLELSENCHSDTHILPGRINEFIPIR